ncbi:hypothetical protein [Fibrobacter sp. UWB5]|uniref:hypothetical protein n=1 Tax=Fibrobacter sp. UWB5 TaxID=1964360 RepID=UPI000B51F3ED|nr:hypothetical protein [Fibrobacter sp. UWB5]OWV14623.1 hypothetical protein B7989_04020 [Fibrobacter sp. UWB5]
MGFSNKLFVCAFGAMSLLAGCGSSGSNDDKPSSPAADTPDTPSFNVSGCQEMTDANAQAQLESAKANIVDILQSLGEGDFHNAQVISAQTKATFKSVLDKYPASCEAQLGYALGIVTDLVNNKEIKGFIDTVSNKNDLVDMNVNDYNRLLMTADGKLLTSVAQTAMAEAIPSLDSAIIYMRNIVNNKDFTCKYTYKDRTFELDRGEFAPALAGLFVAKAALTLGASMNIDFSENGNYDWMNDLENYNEFETSKVSMRQVESLLNKKSSFTTIYDSWKSSYKNIPNLLDSAISYVELGLQYGIEESKLGTATQTNDPYIVGDGEMSDVSVKDFQKAIDSLEYYRQGLRTGVEVTLPQGSKITINVAKFFEITDGFQEYLPYHHVNDPSVWFKPDQGYGWADILTGKAYAEHEIGVSIMSELSKTMTLTGFHAWVSSYYSWYYEDVPAVPEVCMDIEDANDYYYNCYTATVNNCTVTFTITEDSYRSNDLEFVPSPVKLSSEVCKVENGVSKFATAYQYQSENYFYFTDASGKKTVSLQGLDNGYLEGNVIKDYSARDLSKLIYFPDFTFGGVFPGMTAEKFWNIIITESEEDEDDYYEGVWNFAD